MTAAAAAAAASAGPVGTDGGADGGGPEEGSGAAEQPADLRLVGPAVATWLGCFAGTGAGAARWAAAATAAIALGLAAGLSWGRHARPRGGPDPKGAARARAAAAVLLSLGGGLAVGSVHLRALTTGPVDELAAERAWMTGSVTVTADPRRVPSRVTGYGRPEELVTVPVRVEHLVSRGRSVRVRAPVLAFASHRAWARLLPGQQVEVSGRLGPARAGQPVSAVLSVRGPPGRPAPPSLVQQGAGRLREGLRTASEGLGAPERGLLPGLVVGDTSRMPDGLEADFRTAGLTHLTAVSGANLAIVTGFVLLVGRQLGLRGRWLPLVAAVAMVGFVVLARPQPSVLRAGAMGAVALAALASGRRRRSLAALGATVVVLLLLDPWLSRAYGFVLSVLATGALVMLAPGWARRWQARGVPAVLAHALAVPLAAQLVTAPVVTMLAGQVSLVAVPANLLAGPAVAPATVLGVLATVASPLHQPTARLLAEAGGLFVWWVVQVARAAADAPLAAVAWPASVPGAVLLAALSVAGALLARRLSRQPARAAGAAVLVTVALVVPASEPRWPPADWLLAVCDVGQGDALVLSAGGGAGVVVDAGPDPALVDGCLQSLGVRKVPVVLLTHLHADHTEGLRGVLRRRVVGEVQVGPFDGPSPELARVLSQARAARVPVTRAALGDRVRVGPLTWQVLWPARVIRAGSVPNNASTVILVRTRGVLALLMGDVEPEAQRALLARGGLGAVDVLKVAHHGSGRQAPELLPVVRPRVALVSVGADNDYGHPSPSVLAALSRAGAVVGRTDLDGTLVVAGDRHALRLVARAG